MTLSLHIPQILFLVLLCMGLGQHLAKNGEQRADKYNFGLALICTVIEVALLTWGGFFTE